jgi:hypothetical protein
MEPFGRGGLMAMAVIDRTKFKHDDAFGALRGRFAVDGQKFEAIITVPEKRPERAWAVAEKAVDLVLNRFPAIEKDIEKGLATRLVMWIDKKVAVSEVSRRVVAAMKATKVITLSADEEYANVYFKGPRFVRGHAIEVTMTKRGKLYVKLAG